MSHIFAGGDDHSATPISSLYHYVPASGMDWLWSEVVRLRKENDELRAQLSASVAREQA